MPQDEMKALWKKSLPIVGIAAVMLLYVLLKCHTQTAFPILMNELCLLFAGIAAWCDIRQQKIPNRLILLILAAWGLILVPQLLLSVSGSWGVLIGGVAGFVFSGLLMLLVYGVSRRGLGGGDVKFVAAAGCYLGIAYNLMALLVGSILAAVMGIVMILTGKMKRTDSFPFVPFLYVGILVVLFFG